MKKIVNVIIITLLGAILITGCGGGGSSDDNTNPAIADITGMWQGGMTFTLFNDPGEVYSYHMEADFVQTGSIITGDYELFEIDGNHAIHTGIFADVSRTDNEISGYMVDFTHNKGAPAFDSPLIFGAIITELSISGSGSVTMDEEDWSVIFTLTQV